MSWILWMRVTIVAILVMAALFLIRLHVATGEMAFVATASAQGASRSMRRGERLVSTHCAMCHAIGRADSSPHRTAPPLRIVLRRYPMESLQESLIEGLTSGHPEMPTFRFSDGDAAAILSYLESIQQK